MCTQPHAKTRAAACKKCYSEKCYRLFKIIYSAARLFGAAHGGESKPEECTALCAQKQGSGRRSERRQLDQISRAAITTFCPARQLDQTTKTARKSRFFLEKRAFLWYNKHRKQVQTYSSGAADQRQRMRTGAGAAAGTLDRKPADRAKTRPTAAAAGCPAG